MRALGVAMVFTALAASIVGCASTEPAAPEVIAQRATASGISPDLVYVTAVDGYDLAPQSVGRTGADGMSASWFNAQTGGILTVRTDRGTLTPQTCPEMPLWDTLDGGVGCRTRPSLLRPPRRPRPADRARRPSRKRRRRSYRSHRPGRLTDRIRRNTFRLPRAMSSLLRRTVRRSMLPAGGGPSSSIPTPQLTRARDRETSGIRL